MNEHPKPPKGYKNWLEVYYAVLKEGKIPDLSQSIEIVNWHEGLIVGAGYYRFIDICFYAFTFVLENLPTDDEVMDLLRMTSGGFPQGNPRATISKLMKLTNK